MILTCRVFIVIAIMATVASTLSVYPHQLAYFNEAVGGPASGHKHLLNSNLDWGQDLLLVRKWMQQNEVSPDEIEFHACHAYPAVKLVAHGGEPASIRWQIVSSCRIVKDDNRWPARLNDHFTQRIGYTLWAIPTR